MEKISARGGGSRETGGAFLAEATLECVLFSLSPPGVHARHARDLAGAARCCSFFLAAAMEALPLLPGSSFLPSCAAVLCALLATLWVFLRDGSSRRQRKHDHSRSHASPGPFAVVSGAGSGIGFAAAKQLHASGYQRSEVDERIPENVANGDSYHQELIDGLLKLDPMIRKRALPSIESQFPHCDFAQVRASFPQQHQHPSPFLPPPLWLAIGEMVNPEDDLSGHVGLALCCKTSNQAIVSAQHLAKRQLVLCLQQYQLQSRRENTKYDRWKAAKREREQESGVTFLPDQDYTTHAQGDDERYWPRLRKMLYFNAKIENTAALPGGATPSRVDDATSANTSTKKVRDGPVRLVGYNRGVFSLIDAYGESWVSGEVQFYTVHEDEFTVAWESDGVHSDRAEPG